MAAQLLPMLVEALAPLAMALLSWASWRLAGLIKARVHREGLEAALLRANDVVFDVVSDLQSAVVEDLKTQAADGKLSRDDIIEVKSAALLRAKRLLGGAEGAKRLMKVLGFGDDEHRLDEWLRTKIESSVRQMRASEPRAS